MDTYDERREILRCILDFGALYLTTGAEISRVEDTLSRLGKAYGASSMNVFVITSSIVITMEFPDGESATGTRRIMSAGSTNFARFEALNELSRECCSVPLPVAELGKRIEDAGRIGQPFTATLIGSMLAGSSLAVFFGSTIAEGAAAAFFGAVICLLQSAIGRTRLNTAASNLLISFIVGIAAGLFCRMIPGMNADRVLIGDIMLLIPGIAMTNAVQNILVGNPLSGSVRIVESLIWAGALAGGTMMAMLLLSMI